MAQRTVGENGVLEPVTNEVVRDYMTKALRAQGGYEIRRGVALHVDTGVEAIRVIDEGASYYLDASSRKVRKLVEGVLTDLGVEFEVHEFGSWQNPQLEVVVDTDRIDTIRSKVSDSASGVHSLYEFNIPSEVIEGAAA